MSGQREWESEDPSASKHDVSVDNLCPLCVCVFVCVWESECVCGIVCVYVCASYDASYDASHDASHDASYDASYLLPPTSYLNNSYKRIAPLSIVQVPQLQLQELQVFRPHNKLLLTGCRPGVYLSKI